MPTGTKKSDIHPVFKKRLDDLVAKAAATSAGFRAAGQRPWNIPNGMTGADLLDIAKLHEPAFNRQTINTNYEQCFQDVNSPGTVADVIALKLQVDYNAAEERAFRFRHASVCRCIVHGIGRRHGESIGPTFPYIEETIADVVAAGAVGVAAAAAGAAAGAT